MDGNCDMSTCLGLVNVSIRSAELKRGEVGWFDGCDMHGSLSSSFQAKL